MHGYKKVKSKSSCTTYDTYDNEAKNCVQKYTWFVLRFSMPKGSGEMQIFKYPFINNNHCSVSF